ncbi:MAG: hypothetical protein ACJ8H8_16785, partial [Geminicoccaceae bacterium]
MRQSTLPSPRTADPAAAERGLARWRHLAGMAPDPALAGFMTATLDRQAELMGAIFAGSPFLGEALGIEPSVPGLLHGHGPDQAAHILAAELDAVA